MPTDPFLSLGNSHRKETMMSKSDQANQRGKYHIGSRADVISFMLECAIRDRRGLIDAYTSSSGPMRTICWRTKRWKDEPCADCDNGCSSSASPTCSNAQPLGRDQRRAISNLAHCVRNSKQKLPQRMRDYAESVIRMLEDGRI